MYFRPGFSDGPQANSSSVFTHSYTYRQPKDVNLNFQLKRSSRFDVWSNFEYCDFLTITSHICVHKLEAEHFSPVVFNMGYKKNMSFLVVPKPQQFENK